MFLRRRIVVVVAAAVDVDGVVVLLVVVRSEQPQVTSLVLLVHPRPPLTVQQVPNPVQVCRVDT